MKYLRLELQARSLGPLSWDPCELIIYLALEDLRTQLKAHGQGAGNG